MGRLMMKRKQQIHDGTFDDHEGITQMLKENHKYPGFEKDKKEVLDNFLHGHDVSLQRALDGVERIARIHKGDRSEAVLVELDSLKFTYEGWKDDQTDVEYNLDRKAAKRGILSMKRKQQLKDGTCNHVGIIRLVKQDNFTYPDFEEDKNEALLLFSQGYDISLNRALEGIDQQQRMHAGDRSDDVLVELDASVFTYKGWQHDKREVEANLDRKHAMRLLLAMKRKEQLYKETVRDDGIIMLMGRGNYKYPGFKRDKKEAMEMFSQGYELSLQRQLKVIEQKQRAHNGDRTDYELILVDLHRTAFTYNGWKDDMVKVEGPEHKDIVQRLFQGMKRKQQIHDKTCAHPGIARLQRNEFDYPAWEKDKESTLILFTRGHDVSCQRSLDAMDQRQSIYESYKADTPAIPDQDCCVICTEKRVECTFVPCGHLCVCSDCAELCTNETPIDKCPVCMEPHTSIMKIYH